MSGKPSRRDDDDTTTGLLHVPPPLPVRIFLAAGLFHLLLL
jgi:hypothetical protein